MFFNPAPVVVTIVMIVVTGWVVRGVIASWFKLRRDGGSSANLAEMEDRLRKVESTTTSLLLEVQTIREKERFMAKLQASATTREIAAKSQSASEAGVSPMDTQSIPVIPRVRPG